MGFIFFLIVMALIVHGIKKAIAKKKAEDQARLWLAQQRLLAAQRAQAGEVIEPGHVPHYPPRPSVKGQLAMLGLKVLVGAIAGQHHRHSNHNHHNQS